MQERTVTRRYVDPLDQIWLAAAQRIGLRVTRHPDVFAATDGAGTLSLAPPEALDPDDCLAQMILHELCHSLVMGPESFGLPDWGLSNETDEHRVLEYACLRLQAALLEPLGLRHVLAPTTDYRAFYDSLEADPFALPTGAFDDGSVVRARVALRRSRQRPWAPHLHEALQRSATIVHAVGRQQTAGSDNELPSLYDRLAPRALPHPAGFVLDPVADRTCGHCGWYFEKKNAGHCRQADGARVEAAWPSCDHFEADIDCLTCGACCREAYDVVAVALRDPAIKRHKHLMVVYDGRAEMQRSEGRCVALQGGTRVRPELPHQEPTLPRHMPSPEPFTCAIYDERPRTCRDFARAGEHCLTARRRVGLSR